MSLTSETLVYWDTHTGFGEVELDSQHGRIGIYRTELLKTGVKTPQIGDRFHFSTGVVDTAVNKPRSRVFDFIAKSKIPAIYRQ